MRKIVHVDMDAFYVSVEIRDNPDLRGKPVAVGGKSDRRGVLSTCNYIARQYGVSSAMPTAVALRKCPHLVVVPGRMEVYKQISDTIRRIFESYTPLIEPLSLDEAYLDVSDCTLYQGSATRIAQAIREDIYRQTGLTASAGIAPIKFLAKIASDLNKPNGQFTITPEQKMDFIQALPLNKIPGVGKVTYQRLKNLGFEVCGDVRQASEEIMVGHLGKFGLSLWNKSQGIDDREVVISRIRKSVGVERTFDKDISQFPALEDIMLNNLLPELQRRSERHLKEQKMKKLGVKVKFNDFQQTTREYACRQVDQGVLSQLLKEALGRGKGKSVRLLGLHIGLQNTDLMSSQLELDLTNQP